MCRLLLLLALHALSLVVEGVFVTAVAVGDVLSEVATASLQLLLVCYN